MTSPETDRLIQTQLNRGEIIARFWSNILKHEKDKLTDALLEQCKELLSSYWKKSDAVGTDYLREDFFSQFESNYTETCANIVEFITKRCTPGESKGLIQSSCSSDNIHAHLPKIELPTFSGNLLKERELP
ncbi:hypothetical protein J437_LFUL018331 [Ladona fulva]|uniref:Uncharacterized protein n=1 Tax=Ladona fulva TaxID=123851 RepID=A0A8K0KPG5_LADFU|nr:hypothetical protein J437_LFUL018331 [Ladona fulva]